MADVPDLGEGCPVVYAGRFADKIADLPCDCVVLGEGEALPLALERTLIVLDLPSFPFEKMTEDGWDLPIVVVLPPSLSAEDLVAEFGPVLFERLGFFDRIVTPDPDLWEELRRRYSWAEGQRLPLRGDLPVEVVRTVCASLEAGGVSGKVYHRAQAAVLEPLFAARGAPLDVLEVGADAGRWASSFDLQSSIRFIGVEAREDLVERARANFPEGRFDLLGTDLLLPYEDESFDLVFSVTVMHRNPTPAKRTLLSEMWRATRPGGRLLFLEDFVFTKRQEEPDVHPMSVMEFMDLILDATAGRVTLEHAESLRYPGEDLHRGGLISLRRLGDPST